MNKRKRKYIKYKKERVILSDVLPFEVPITFSNRHLYEYITKNQIVFNSIDNKIACLKNNTDVTQAIIRLIFGISHEKPFIDGQVNIEKAHTIPFSYKISHKENDYRELCIVHPKNQLKIIDFYEKYKEMILYYCSRSAFSIRKPHRVAKYTYYADRIHLQKLADASDGIIDENDKEYENLRTFFVYKKYSNIHKFYESYQYHRAEKRFNRLLKFDISKCFDSIYSHTISWALVDKETIKQNLDYNRGSFGSKFDSLMQELNYNETNGIVIGPEFSRIFAELILQKIDTSVEQDLTEKGLKYKTDFEIFRYVDDYFIFYNDETCVQATLSAFRLRLREFKLYFNDAKTQIFDKPIITGITIAKQKISELMNENFKYTLHDEFESGVNGEINVIGQKGAIHINSNRIITKFKTIISESNVEYKDILNYSFVILERKLKILLRQYFKIIKEAKNEREFIQAILELLDFIFFLYAVSPKVNTTLRLCRILRLVIEALSLKDKFKSDMRNLVFKKIYDNIFFILQKNRSSQHMQVETLYLLITIAELGNQYWLSEEVLAEYLGIQVANGNFTSPNELNYFAIVVSLFYMKSKVRYDKLRTFIIHHVEKKFENTNSEVRMQRSEFSHLLMDILAYPYTDITLTKRKLLNLYKISDQTLQNKIIGERRHWFTNWSNFKFGKELDSRQSQEVY
jgi:hypothetical protein